jgi:D-glycero-D-manno-heptose 1,7-bisphosphate phosphatase
VGADVTRRFVLVDRDGTINVQRAGEYVLAPSDIELLPGAAEGLGVLQNAGLGLIVVSNQAPVARGWIDEAELDRINARLLDLLDAEGVRIDGIYCCPHDTPDGCGCRKPAPGLLVQAASDHGFLLDEAFVVGDKGSDIEAGRRVGCTTILVLTGEGREAAAEATGADRIASDLPAAAAVIATLAQEQTG